MLTIGDVYDLLKRKVPLETKMDFDNVGLLAGCRSWPVSAVLLSLDITGPVIEEAQSLGAELVVSHHPLFFSLKAVSDLTPQGEKTAALLSNRISAICMHTNLDAMDGGVNDALAAALDVLHAAPFEPEHVGRLGTLAAPMPLAVFLPRVKTALHAAGIRYVDGGRPISRVAVGGGSCGSMLEEAYQAGCDAFVTADVKYDVFLRAKELGVSLLDAGHFCTENVVLPVLADWLQEAFPQLAVRLAAHGQTEQYYV